MLITVNRYHFSSQNYFDMIAAGILSEHDRVELIQGEVVQMAAIGSRHAACVNRLNHLLTQRFGSQPVIISVQNPIHLSDGNVPEPDISLLRHQEHFYANALPTAKDVHLVINVADSSLEYDQAIKLPLYAAAGIPACWLIDLTRHQVSVCQGPGKTGYGDIQVYQSTDILQLAALGLSLSVSTILPRES